jgi:SAM-dependent methyltransferase
MPASPIATKEKPMSNRSTALAAPLQAVTAPKRDVHFSAAMHLRNLLRIDRTLSVREAVRSAVTKGARVLDAGCGSGLLSFLAVAAGAGEVIGIDRDHVDLARALARENGFGDRIRFIEGDLTTLDSDDLAGKFDVIFAFIYTNHIIIDEARSQAVCSLRRRFGTPNCITVPNRVRYRAIPCDWPQLDTFSELADMRRAVADMENRYGLKFGALLDLVSSEVAYARSRPVTFSDYEWLPGNGGLNGGYHHRRAVAGGRFLGDPAAVVDIAYDGGAAFEGLPKRIALDIASAGTLNAVMWNQELWFNDFLIWSTEVFSPTTTATAVRAGDRILLALDESWRATNALSL